MKTKIEWSPEYKDIFEPVAKRIADPPPLWLLVSLNHFATTFISTEANDFDASGIIEQMDYAAGVLLNWLPSFAGMPGFRCPDDVAVVLGALPAIKRDLERLRHKQKGRKPNVRRQVHAAVVCEVWRMLHGKVEPRSERLYEACNAYWLACTGEQIDLLDWRRHVEQAEQPWVRVVLEPIHKSIPGEAVQNSI